MTKHRSIRPGLLALMLAVTPALADPATEQPPMPAGDARFHNPAQIKWQAAPPHLPPGGKIAVLMGDPGQPGPYVIRLMMPTTYRIAPHWHSQAEHVTVISGTLYLGMGNKLDMKAAHTLKAGGFHSIAPNVHHYAFSKTATVVQIHGEGPFDIHYVDPADLPKP